MEDLFGHAFRMDPYATYDRLRAAPPHWYEHPGQNGGMWLLTRYEDVSVFLKSPHITKNPNRFRPAAATGAFDQNMLAKDPPDHGRLRSLAARAFTGDRVDALQARVWQVARQLAKAAAAAGGMEFMADFATALPAIVISELLGVPSEDRACFRQMSNAVLTGIDASSPRIQEHREAGIALGQYFSALLQSRRRNPRDDLLSAMVHARDAQDRLSENELLALCMLLLIAGHETTVNLLGNGLYALLRHPAQLGLLKRDLRLLPSAVEEMLRFESPVQRATFRLTTEAIALGGTVIEQGQQVSAVIGAANRDPAQFSRSEVFDIARQPNRHLAFGLGIHFCLGPMLARMEARIAFHVLLEMFPGLHLGDAAPAWETGSSAVRGLRALPVLF